MESILDKAGYVWEELNHALEQEARYWAQRSRVSWLKKCDKNTTFFHGIASLRRKNNTIRGLEEESGEWCKDDDGIKDIASRFFRNLFQPQVTLRCYEIIDGVERCITDEINSYHIAEFTNYRQLVLSRPHFLMSKISET